MTTSQTEEAMIHIIEELQKRYGSALKSKLIEEAEENGIGKVDKALKGLVEKGLVNEIVPNAIYSLGTPGYCPTCIEAIERLVESSKGD